MEEVDDDVGRKGGEDREEIRRSSDTRNRQAGLDWTDLMEENLVL